MSWPLPNLATAREKAAVVGKPDLAHLSLDDLIAAYNNRRRGHEGSGLTVDEARTGFESTKSDAIDDLSVCKNLDGTGTVLTRKNRIYMRYPPSEMTRLQPEFEETLWRARKLANEGPLLLQGTKLRVLLERLQSVIVYLFGVLESQHKEQRTLFGLVDLQHKEHGSSGNGRAIAGRECRDPGEKRIEAAIATATRELSDCKGFLMEAAETVGRKFYLLGVVAGLVITFLLVLAAVQIPLGNMPGRPLALVAAAGAVGAVVSVMTRIYQGNFRVDPRESHVLNACVGAFRPVIGAVMATAIYFAISGTLLPIRHPEGEPQSLYFLAVFAFVAGFTERWAQDVLVTATAKTAPSPERGGAGQASTASTHPDTQLSHAEGNGHSPEGAQQLSTSRTIL